MNLSVQQQDYIYALQDANADMQKRIHSLEMVLRDNGFDKDGDQKMCITGIDNKVEMMSMMGMDAERTTGK